MRVAYVSHSLVAERQEWFAAELRRQLEAKGGALLEVFPGEWGRHRRNGGWVTLGGADMARYWYAHPMWDALKRFDPDVVLVQQEAYCLVTSQFAGWCRLHGKKLVTFSWENLVPVDENARKVLESAAFNIYGNSEARALAAKAGVANPSCVLPQVGVDPNTFRPAAVAKEWDILWNGRQGDPMKGEDVLDEAANGMPWKVAKGYNLGFAEYASLANRYSKARVVCVPSQDVPGRPREQFAPAVTVEALMCGVPVVTTTQSAIKEWTTGLPGVVHVRQGDWRELHFGLQRLLGVTDGHYETLAAQAREVAVDRFSNEAVARKYIHVFEEVMA